MRLRSLASTWINIKFCFQKNVREGEKTIQAEMSVNHSWYLYWRESSLTSAAWQWEKTLANSLLSAWVQNSQGWNVLASHLALLASFETDFWSVWQVTMNKTHCIIWGLRTVWKHLLLLGWGPAEGCIALGTSAGTTSRPFPQMYQKISMPIEITWSKGASAPFTGCSVHCPRSGLEGRSFPMIFQAGLEDNAGIAGRVYVFSDFKVTIFS